MNKAQKTVMATAAAAVLAAAMAVGPFEQKIKHVPVFFLETMS